MTRQRSSDLFPTDQPIPASQMIGREADVDELATTLAGGGNVIVAGPRRTGKTSACDAALGRLERDGTYTVSVDLFRLATAGEHAEALVASAIANRSPLRRIRSATWITRSRCPAGLQRSTAARWWSSLTSSRSWRALASPMATSTG